MARVLYSNQYRILLYHEQGRIVVDVASYTRPGSKAIAAAAVAAVRGQDLLLLVADVVKEKPESIMSMTPFNCYYDVCDYFPAPSRGLVAMLEAIIEALRTVPREEITENDTLVWSSNDAEKVNEAVKHLVEAVKLLKPLTS